MLAAAENALLCNWMGVGLLITDAGRTSRDTKKKKKESKRRRKRLDIEYCATVLRAKFVTC